MAARAISSSVEGDFTGLYWVYWVHWVHWVGAVWNDVLILREGRQKKSGYSSLCELFLQLRRYSSSLELSRSFLQSAFRWIKKIKCNKKQ